ncbi:MAG: Ldh family oxidoreductase [Pseudomonadota bacterium]
MTDLTLSVDQIRALAAECLIRHGCNETNANAVATTIAHAERDGCHSHGLMRLAGYVAALDSGKVNGHANPRTMQIAPAVLRVDGDGGFAPLALAESRDEFIALTQHTGIAAMGIANTHHFAALWAEVEPLATAGLCAMACVSYKPAVIPAGGQQPLYGTNPMAFGWPRKDAPPVLFDQASAVMARGEVMLAAREGHTLPEGVGVDKAGQPTTDPNAILDGALLAFGGHKGSSIAMMIELLAGPLIGEVLSLEAAANDNNDGGPPRGGEFLLAMDPSRFGDADGWADHAEALFARISAQPGARLPSSRRYEARATALRNGVEISRAVHDKIRAL